MFHFLIQFEPLPGKTDEFRAELQRVRVATQAEPGCVEMQVFESVREPVTFAIHSVWVDEAAFDLHASLPHTAVFVEAAERLLGQPVRGVRMRSLSPLDRDAEHPGEAAGAV